MNNDLEEAGRRKELGGFLQAQRAKLTPAPAAATRGRRRVKGLRREEVAERAGIGVAWYTWLEQGRSINVSSETLQKIAKALEMKEQEERYFFLLASRMPPAPDPLQHTVPSSLRRILNSLNPSPAYVLNECWDVLDTNTASDVLFGSFKQPDRNGCNLIWRLFHDLGWKELYQDWERYARCSVAHLRNDVMARPSVRSKELVDALLKTSLLFRTWWESYEVITPQPTRKRFYRIDQGELLFELTILQVQQAPHPRLFVYSPVNAPLEEVQATS